LKARIRADRLELAHYLLAVEYKTSESRIIMNYAVLIMD